MKAIAVIGAGRAGRELACAAAQGGYKVILEDVSAQAIEQGIGAVREALEESVSEGRITPAKRQQALTELSTARNVEDACRAADLIIEALPDELEAKLEVFTILDKFAKPGAILASNTSSLAIADLAEITFRPEECIGMRLRQGTAHAARLEIVRAERTSDATVAICVEVARRMGKEAVIVKESPEVQKKGA